MSDYSNYYVTGWYSISPSFTWWNRPVPNVDTINQSKETERVAQKNKFKEKEDKKRVIGKRTVDIYA
jgi:hypothetical protein